VSHTAIEIAALLNKLTNKDFHIESRLDAVTTDNGANFVAAIEELLQHGVCEESVKCACHTLQLTIKKSYEVCCAGSRRSCFCRRPCSSRFLLVLCCSATARCPTSS
jgi:hypothetical protein